MKTFVFEKNAMFTLFLQNQLYVAFFFATEEFCICVICALPYN